MSVNLFVAPKNNALYFSVFQNQTKFQKEVEMYTNSEVKTFQSVLKPLVDHGAINNEIYMVALKAVKDNINASISPEKSQKVRLISVKETAEIFGCCTKTVYRLIDKGVLRRINYGTNSVRFKESDVLALANRY